MSYPKLHQFDPTLKNFLFSLLFLLLVGISVGILFINQTTSFNAAGAKERFNGSEVADEFDIPEHYPKPYSEMLLTTHNHLFGFAFIIGIAGTIFYFNSIITGKLKKLLLYELPFSVLTTFGSIWLLKYVHPNFVYLTIVSSMLLYFSLFVVIFVSMFELKFKKSHNFTSS
ncbi:MAG: hypothetical protein K9J12_01310 [Melioribacteraceae bacterium]|nr:hypothetical protein [Melioribacteraceae bacterium]MCF8266292.1 hypothetical protein [Melioribacteraceae bacterium]MCF8412274.1 hypothetical protein [Melioribacteraceae bacterium]MCF8432504.1 hypothetical protein [Melioribacteraceae bacterium]